MIAKPKKTVKKNVFPPVSREMEGYGNREDLRKVGSQIFFGEIIIYIPLRLLSGTVIVTKLRA